VNLYAKIVSQSRIVILTRRVPDLLAMITERQAEKAEIDEAIEVLERVRSSKLRAGVTDRRRTCRGAFEVFGTTQSILMLNGACMTIPIARPSF